MIDQDLVLKIFVLIPYIVIPLIFVWIDYNFKKLKKEMSQKEENFINQLLETKIMLRSLEEKVSAKKKEKLKHIDEPKP